MRLARRHQPTELAEPGRTQYEVPISIDFTGLPTEHPSMKQIKGRVTPGIRPALCSVS
eukprot:COSAG06_NODE_1630_length_8867_cov_7.747833_9_plen_58_part_00